MTAVGRGLDLLISLIGAGAWAFFAFVLGSRFISHTAGGLLGLALLLSALGMVLSTFLQDARMQRLTAGVCPRCRGVIRQEHRHRRWDATRAEWLQPETSWTCAACDYNHSEPWPCSICS